MERTEEFELALKEAELLKILPNAGALARQFLLLVEENRSLKRKLDEARRPATDDEFTRIMDQIYNLD